MTLKPPPEELVTVSLASILSLPDMQPRVKGQDRAVVRRYRQAMDAGEVFPPILLAKVNDALLLVDGWHGLEAMLAIGLWQTDALVRVADSMAEARLWAYEANRKHGLPLTNAERREMFRVYLKAKRHHGRRRGQFKSYREMGEELGIPKSTLAAWTLQDAPVLAKALAEGRPYGGSNRGGAREEGPERRLAREAHSALALAAASIPGIVNGEERWMLLEKVQRLVEVLEHGPLQKPMF
jgi:hypothetical protein